MERAWARFPRDFTATALAATMMGRPTPPASELAPDVQGLQRPLVLDGAGSKGTEALTTGAILAGFALHLGAGPVVLGIIGAMPFFAQFAQLAGLRLVFRTRARRRVCLGRDDDLGD